MSWQELGVDARDAALYEAMLAAPGTRAEDLVAAGAGVDDVWRRVARLEEHGLVRRVDGVALPVPPDEGIESLIARAQDDIARRLSGIAQARQTLPALVDSYLEGRAATAPTAPYEELADSEAVRSRIYRLATDCVFSARSLVPAAGFSAAATAASQRSDEALLARGVEVSYVVSLESCGDARWRDYLGAIVAAGARVRVHPAPPMLTVLFDDVTALLPSDSHRGAVVLRGAAATAPVSALFREVWADATPYDELVGGESSFSPRHTRVLFLLAEGLTDEAIAKRVGLSSRTVRRLVSEICVTLQAKSRFEAGVEAVRRGLLPLRADTPR